MFLKNKNIIFKIRGSKVTDYAALNKIINLLIQTDIISLVTRLAKDTAQIYTLPLKHANQI